MITLAFQGEHGQNKERSENKNLENGSEIFRKEEKIGIIWPAANG